MTKGFYTPLEAAVHPLLAKEPGARKHTKGKHADWDKPGAAFFGYYWNEPGSHNGDRSVQREKLFKAELSPPLNARASWAQIGRDFAKAEEDNDAIFGPEPGATVKTVMEVYDYWVGLDPATRARFKRHSRTGEMIPDNCTAQVHRIWLERFYGTDLITTFTHQRAAEARAFFDQHLSKSVVSVLEGHLSAALTAAAKANTILPHDYELPVKFKRAVAEEELERTTRMTDAEERRCWAKCSDIVVNHQPAGEPTRGSEAWAAWRVALGACIAMETGSRGKAMTQLRWVGNVDWELGRIALHPKDWKRNRKKVNKTLLISSRLLPVLEAAYKACGGRWPWVLGHNASMQHTFPNYMQRWGFKGFDEEELGPQRLTLHAFRRTNASLLDEAGVELKDIGKNLGHKDVKTTKGYVRRSLKSDAERRRIDARFDPEADATAGGDTVLPFARSEE